jgi:hypothetical protein
MTQIARRRTRLLALDALESRCLLAAPEILGNIGQVVFSQFQPFGFRSTVGTQLWDVKVRGPVHIDVVHPFPATQSAQSVAALPINSGLIDHSQFNGGGFRTVGLQFNRVKLGGGLTVSGFDNEDPGASGATEALSSGVAGAATAGALPAFINTNLISKSQFSDGGFGVLERNAKGVVIAREGRVGLQWRNTKVHGPVDIGLADLIIQPGATSAASAVATAGSALATAAPAVSQPGKTVIDFRTNIGKIQNSQFNDGGFGDIGMQLSDVLIKGRVGTSTNTLFIKPKQDGFGPITLRNLVFGRRAAAASPNASVSSTAQVAAPVVKSANTPAPLDRRTQLQTPEFQTTFANSATNSGRIVHAQVNDGGFGDVGLQWKKVRVGGNVTAVHNSLTVQPENEGQELITVQGIQFPATPPPTPKPAPAPLRVLPPDPPLVAVDGDSVTSQLAPPTGPRSPFFPIPFDGAGTVTLPYPGNFPLVNAATNSGLVNGGQFSAGGFGDDGLQWQKVHVGGNVQIVHNSLSVHPEGSKLAGVSVSDVSYGGPVSRSLARHLKVLPFVVISPGDVSAATNSSLHRGKVLGPPNNRWLTNQQVVTPGGSDVFLQWNGIEHRRGLVLVHNIIKILGVGPTTGPITLSNIRFPFRVPNIAPLKVVASQPIVSASAQSGDAVLLNVANNSGVLSHAQFSSGGFGDDGLQWRNVSVDGSVAVVHNTLALDETADLPVGDLPGPITISNVTFNSGALNGPLSPSRNQFIVSPPDVFQTKSTRGVNLGRPLPQYPKVTNEAVNTGIMAGGQLASGAANHVLLQWQCVKVHGKVTVVDNVLSISVLDRPTGPISISNVTFA